MRRAARRSALLALCWMPACDEGTLNNGGAVDVLVTSRASLSSEGKEGVGISIVGEFSDVGRYLGFTSTAVGLHPEVNLEGFQAYVKDLQSGELVLVGRKTGADGDLASSATLQSMSADGRRVVMTAMPSLDPVLTHPDYQVYLRDLDTLETRLISRASGGGAAANSFSGYAKMSGNGLRVAFTSWATNLVAEDTDGIIDVYLHDIPSAATTLISRATGTSGAKGNGHSSLVDINFDGSVIFFNSASTNLTPDVLPEPSGQLFIRDLNPSPPRTSLISRAAGENGPIVTGPFLPGASGGGMTPDGRYVVFTSNGTNLHSDDADDVTDVYLRDLSNHSVELISRASGVSGAKALSFCRNPRISHDGRFVSFESLAANLVPDDGNDAFDLFVRDRLMQTTLRLSVRTFGSEIAQGVSGSSIAGNGSKVVFGSSAPDIVHDDANGFADLFIRGLRP